jgi:hypothetical protein
MLLCIWKKLVKMCLNESHKTVCEQKYLFDMFKIQNGFSVGML